MARRIAASLALAVLLLAAAAGTWRSVRPNGPTDPARSLAAELRCPACQGESVADSRSPIAAAMRDAISAQLAQGHRPEEVRAYLVRRYGPEILAAPPAHGVALLLWAAPAFVLLAGLAPAAVRAVRRTRRTVPAAGHRARSEPAKRRTPRSLAGDGTRRASSRPRPRAAGARIWNISAVCLLALVGGVALATPHPPARPEPATTADPVPGQLALARSMEEQGSYGAAAEVYRTALERQPADDIRLRLAFTLIRSGQADEAERLARQVLASQPDAPDALLMLGLAQRATDRDAAGVTLRRFLARAPAHPAAAEIRRLLDSG
jgi:cytochrome c-type biogenesis protein CcmH/NrfF